MHDLFTFGEVMALFLASDTDSVINAKEFAREVAGAEANVSVGLTRLGLRVKYLSKVGADELGDAVLKSFESEGVDTSLILRSQSFTGILIRNRGTTRPVHVTYVRKESAGSELCAADISEEFISQSRWVHVTGISAAISRTGAEAVKKALSLAVEFEKPRSLDLNIRRKLWSEKEAQDSLLLLAPLATHIFGGVDEYEVVWGNKEPLKNLESALKCGARVAIMTSGDGLIRVLSADGYMESMPPRISAVDPVGSGDAFVAGTISALIAGLSLENAVAQGARCGAGAASKVGDWAGLPYGKAGVINADA
jgi:2-dehydro-3-deoxygluconokinase